MTAKTFADQFPALGALAQMTAAFGHLPAADINISPLTPDEVTISVHDDLDGFERWRAALGIATADIDHQQRPGRSHMTLKAVATFGGATVELVGYAPALASIGGAL